MDYIGLGQTLIAAQPQARTLPGDAQGQRIWIKRVTPAKDSPWHTVQKIFAGLSGKPILRSTVSAGGAVSLGLEAQRLRDFRAKGVHVPQVLAENAEMLVLSDAGPALRSVLDGESDPAPLLLIAARALKSLHEGGGVHGRPYLRDLTWDGARIGFLDLEEDPSRVMPLPAAQARDVWIFLSSAARFARKGGDKYSFDPALIGMLYNEYRSEGGVEAELRSFVKFLRPLRRLLEQPFLWTKIGNDGRQAVFISHCLEDILL